MRKKLEEKGTPFGIHHCFIFFSKGTKKKEGHSLEMSFTLKNISFKAVWISLELFYVKKGTEYLLIFC